MGSREVVWTVGAAAILVASGCAGVERSGDSGAAAAETGPGEVLVRGVVFDDRDGDGVRDEGERGVRGVKVSNGVDVVVTDRQGRYEVAIDDQDGSVFVIKPRGWMVGMNELNMPRYGYIHKPGGSPDDGFIYAGIEPTGELPASVDFGLTRQPEPDRFEALFFGDPQPYTEAEVAYYLRQVVMEAREEVPGAAFTVVLGDLVGDYLELYEPYNQANALLGMPVWNVYGNHDMNFMSDTDEHADETFERVFGPSTYAFQYGPVHFIVLNNVEYLGFDGLRDDGFPRTGNYTGRLRDWQLEFVENLVATIPSDERIVLAMHIPLYQRQGGKHSTPEHGRLMEILSGHPHTMSWSAHTHMLWSEFLGADKGYATSTGSEHHHVNAGATSGSWWRGPMGEDLVPNAQMADGVPNGYVVATFDGNDYELRWKSAGRPADEQMHINLPGDADGGVPGDVTSAEEFAEMGVVVNAYLGTERDEVRVRVVDHAGREVLPWRRAQHFRGIDARFKRLSEGNRAHGPADGEKTLGDPRESSHLYEAAWGVELEPGTYVVEAEFTDMFGNVHRGERPVRIE